MSEEARSEILQNKQNSPPGLVSLERIMRDVIHSGQSRAFHVLIVDDEFLIRYSVSKALSQLGVAVDVADNGLQAQHKIKDGNFNLVITDFNMPEMNGVDLLGWMKEKRPQIEGIMMTGYDLDESITNELSGLVTDYLVKPFPMSKLQKAVMKSMDRFKAGEGMKLEEKED